MTNIINNNKKKTNKLKKHQITMVEYRNSSAVEDKVAAALAKLNNIAASGKDIMNRMTSAQASMTGVKSGFKNVDSQLQQMDEIKLRIDQKMAAKVKEANAWAAAQKK